jgi:hypothetical protein
VCLNYFHVFYLELEYPFQRGGGLGVGKLV